MSQLLGKKMKFRGGKKRYIKFPYSSIEPERTQQAFDGAKRLNKLFIKASFSRKPLEKKDKFPKK